MFNTVNRLNLLQSRKKSSVMIRLRVKELAEAKGFNQSSLSRASDVSFLTIKRIFRDPHKDVAMSTLEKLARALGVRVADLFEEIPDDDKQA